MKITIVLLIVVLLSSCQKESLDAKITSPLKVKVMLNNEPCPNASLICVFTNQSEALLRCDEKGECNLDATNLKMIVAVAPHLHSIVNYPGGQNVELSLRPVLSSGGNKSTSSVATFGVYDTDSNGDVRFRYQGAFQYYYCINSLPSIPPNSPNPNNWDGWTLSDFVPWNGRKLLVPRTYQWYHSAVYGYSISDALMLVSEI